MQSVQHLADANENAPRKHAIKQASLLTGGSAIPARKERRRGKGGKKRGGG